MSDNPIQPGYYWASPKGSNDREVVRVGDREWIDIIGSDGMHHLSDFTNYVPVPSEAEVAELRERIDYLETVDLEAGEFNDD